MDELRLVKFVSSFPSRRCRPCGCIILIYITYRAWEFLFLLKGPCSLSLFYIEKDIMNDKYICGRRKIIALRILTYEIDRDNSIGMNSWTICLGIFVNILSPYGEGTD